MRSGKTIYKQLDININNTLDSFNKEKWCAQTAEEVLKVIDKEQKFLGNLHNNIKYPDQHLNILDKCKLAHDQIENNTISDLANAVEQSLDVKVKTEDAIIDDLRHVTDLQKCCQKIDVEIQNHQIITNLTHFEVEKEISENPIEILQVLEQEELYLVDVKNQLKYPDHINDEISEAINTAINNKEQGLLDDLHKLVTFTINDKLVDNQDIVNYLKEPESVWYISQSIIQEYQNKYLEVIEKNLERIESKGEVVVDRRSFTNCVEYLDSIIDSRQNLYSPILQIEEMRDVAKTNEVELPEKDNPAPELEQEIKGMDFER